MTNYFKYFFSKNSLLRDLQINEFQKLKLNKKCIEFGADENLTKNFLKKNKKIRDSYYSNLKSLSKDIIKIDLEKKNVFKDYKKKFNNVIILNVLEHLKETNTPLQNINKLLYKNGQLIGSTPFLYRIHGAPKDYYRFTEDSLIYNLKNNGFKKIKIIPLGLGPFLASYSLLRGYLKHIPIVYQLLLLIVLLLDLFIIKFLRINCLKLFPLGYFFRATKR
jgi:hypothetical protein